MFFRAKNKIINHWTVKYRSVWPKFILRSKTHFPKVWHSSIKYYLRCKAKSLDCEKKVTMTYIFFLVKGRTTMTHYHTVWQLPIKYYLRYKTKSMDHEKINHSDLHCFRAKAALHWLIITKYNVQKSNSLQDIRQNHWTMKYRSQWPINILRSDVGSYWLIVPKYDVQLLNSFRYKANSLDHEI